MNYTMNEIHKTDIEIFKQFLYICKKYKLNYYMIGGTFLGAIRHKGFIPWDDDMDIAMPRKDFDKFLEVANDELPENYKLSTYYNDEEHRYYLPKLVDLNTKIIEKRYEKINKTSNVFIDIFPIDGTPNNTFLRKIYYLRILVNRMLVSWYYIDSISLTRKRTKLEKILINFGKILPTKKIINPRKRLNKIDKLLKKNSYDDSKYVGTIMGAYRIKEIVPKEYFGTPTKYKFENMELYGPELYDEYLSHMYGNYMTPPKNMEDTHFQIKEENQ